MPVLTRCPMCGAVMPDARGGEARCPRCAEMVLPALRKLCAGCGKDVTREKRVRDEHGEYFCHDCWSEKLAARGEEPGYVCNTCGGLFPSAGVYQDRDELICRNCYAQRVVDPNALLAAAAGAATGDRASAQVIVRDDPPEEDPQADYVSTGYESPQNLPEDHAPADYAMPAYSPATMTPTYLRPKPNETPWGLISMCIAIVIAMAVFIIILSVR